MKKGKWLVRVTYGNSMDITKRVSVAEIGKYLRNNDIKYKFAAEIMQKYVYPYVQETLDDQKFPVKDINIRELTKNE